MKYKFTENDYICTYHEAILNNLKLLKENNDSTIINEIEKLTLAAYQGGKKMEYRLKQYKKAMEMLGFKRDRRMICKIDVI